MASLTARRPGPLSIALGLLMLIVGPCRAEAPPPLPPEAVALQVHDELVEISLEVHTLAAHEQAWKVLTDFEHMAEILPSLSLSEVVSRDGLVLQVHQKGKASFGLLSKAFDTRKQVTLEPERRILSHSESPDVRSSDSETELIDAPKGLNIRYRLKVQLPNANLAGIGGRALRQQTADNFTRLLAAMAAKPH